MHTSYILGHIGLGDQILCNGMIREISEKSDTVYLPVKKHNINNVSDMYKDLKNINYINVFDDQEMLKYFSLMKNIIDKVYSFGIFAKDFMKDAKTFDESFYKQTEIDYNNRWNKFQYVNNLDKQIELLNIAPSNYIFIHDDNSRGLNVTKNIKSNIFNFRPNHNIGLINKYTIFDYIKILENAAEIHCMDSSFACLIDHLPQLYDKPKFIHRYIRKNNNNPLYKNNWIIYD
jgi:hypothetical protein